MECLFCKIADGSFPSKKVYEDEKTLGFLDINPANPGHTLIIPKKHFENIFDADEETLGAMMSAAKAVALSLKEKMGAEGVNVLQNNGRLAGQIVSHIHLHVIPRHKDDKVLITYQRAKTDEKELNEVMKKMTEDIKEDGDDDW